MEALERRRLDKYEREIALYDDSAADFPAGSPGAALKTAQIADIALIKNSAAGQVSGTGGVSQHTSLKDEAIDELMLLIRMINRAANAMGDEIPGIDNLFRLPRNRSEQNILATARSYLTDAAPHRETFVAYDVPSDFLTRLEQLIDAAEASATDADTAGERRAGATGEIKAAFKRCGERSRKMGAIIKNKYYNNPSKLAAWAVASHLERAPKSPGTQTP